MAKIALPEFPDTISKHYPLAFEKFLEFLRKYEANVRFTKDESVFNTNKNFFNLSVEFQFGRYLKFINLNDIEIKLDFFERFQDGQKFDYALEALILECFMELEKKITSMKQKIKSKT